MAFINRKRRFRSSQGFLLYGYFLVLIVLGSILLSVPISWSGIDGRTTVPMIDAVFTAVSAACVTGLATIETAQWTRFGQVVILILIQSGGLGIVVFGMFYLVLPRTRISLKNTRFFRDYFTVGQISHPRVIIKNIVFTTFFFEGIGILLLAWRFAIMGVHEPIFAGIFHAVSAFCNAGFSIFSDGLMSFRNDVVVNLIIMFLIIIGGIGFMVIRDIHQGFGLRRPLLFQTRLMLIATPALIAIAFVGYGLLDSGETFSSLPPGERLMALLFQSVTTRTAGFNTVDQGTLSSPSRWLTLVLMLIGGGSGSTAGGIKVSTACILFLVLFRRVDEKGDIRFLKRCIASLDVGRAAMFFLKAVAILFVSILLLGIFEKSGNNALKTDDLVFEATSALGTVGLSTGITARLSLGGKIVIIMTMFTGRVGLFALVLRNVQDRTENLIHYPKGEVLIG